MKFEKIIIPPGWQESFTKYPNGRTIFEALSSTITTVNEGIEEVNQKVDQGLIAVDQAENTIRQEITESFDTLQLQLEGEIDGLSNDLIADFALLQSEVLTLIAGKANAADVYTKQQVDAQLAETGQRIDNIITTPVPVGEIIAEEIIDARQGESSLPANITKVKTKVAENMTQLKYTKFGRSTKQALITFVDDDAAISSIFTKLKPLYDSKGIVGVSAVNGDATSKAADLLTLQNSGWEIASHSFSHVDLTTLNEAQLRADFEASLLSLRSNGLNVENIVYPYGSSNRLVRRVTKDYFNCAARVGGGINTHPFTQFNLNRVALGSSFDSGSPIGGFTTNSLEYYKYRVDQAIASKSWLIFMTHAFEIDATQLQYISDLIDYVKSLNVQVVTLKRGVELIGNIMENGDKSDVGASYFIADCEGVLYSDSIQNTIKITPANTYNATSPISAFEDGKITETQITDGTGFPSNYLGTLYTHKLVSENGYPFQEYHRYNSSQIYKRFVKTDGVWGDWIQDQQKLPYKTLGVSIGTVNALSTKEISVPYVGVIEGDAVIANYFGTLEPGIMISANISTTDVITLRVANVTNASIFADVRTFNFTILKR